MSSVLKMMSVLFKSMGEIGCKKVGEVFLN